MYIKYLEGYIQHKQNAQYSLFLPFLLLVLDNPKQAYQTPILGQQEKFHTPSIRDKRPLK